jgi:SAM-dependent methyltransferase
VLRAHRWRTAENSAAYLLPELRAGERLLDVGCGPGTVTLGLAERVAPGEVIGVDASTDALVDARAALAASPMPNVRFEEGDVYRLGYDDAAFDVVHAHQLLQHLADPVAALGEMRRVCRGVVAVRDADYGAMTWFPKLALLDRWRSLYEELARANGGEPDAGRELHAWARRAGFGTVEASASAWLFQRDEDRAYWGGQWADRVTTSSFAEQALERGLSDDQELAEIAAAWREWADAPDGWFVVLHGEVLARN